MRDKSEAIAKVMALEPEKRRTAPLRLDIAADLAFPNGGIGASGLRKERDKGRLATFMVAGKEYTTLEEIGLMRERCRYVPKDSARPLLSESERATGSRQKRLAPK